MSKDSGKSAYNVIRKNFNWYVSCPEEGTILAEECYESFLNINALNKKGHHCHNCSFGKNYRQKRSEGVFDITFKDTIYNFDPERFKEKKPTITGIRGAIYKTQVKKHSHEHSKK